MHIEEHGSSDDVVVLLHGNAPPWGLESLAVALADHYRVLLVHRTGWGNTPPTASYDGAKELDRLADALKERSATRLAVVGHSFGTYRMFDLAMRGDIEVVGLLGLGPIAGLPEEARGDMEGLSAFVRGSDMDAIVAVLEQRWFAERYRNANPEVTALTRRAFADSKADQLVHEGLELLDGGRVAALLPRLTVPVHLLVGELDVSTPPEMAEAIAAMSAGATLDRLPNVAHMLSYEAPEETVAWLRRRLSPLFASS